MDYRIPFSVDFDFIKEMRKKWIPNWETSKCVLHSNDFIAPCNLEEIEWKKNVRAYYDVKAEGNSLIETITCGNYIILTTKTEQAEEIAFKINRKFGLLHQETVESDDVELLIERIILKHLENDYPYKWGAGQISSRGCGPDILFEYDRYKKTFLIRKMFDFSDVETKNDLGKIKEGMNESKQFIMDFKKAMKKEKMRIMLHA